MLCCPYLSCVMRKPEFCLCENKGADQLCSNCTVPQLISAFVFTTRITSTIPRASSHFLWLHRPVVCVGPGRKPQKTGFLASRFIFLTTPMGGDPFEQKMFVQKCMPHPRAIILSFFLSHN